MLVEGPRMTALTSHASDLEARASAQLKEHGSRAQAYANALRLTPLPAFSTVSGKCVHGHVTPSDKHAHGCVLC
jgi:hypothetical protein